MRLATRQGGESHFYFGQRPMLDSSPAWYADWLWIVNARRAIMEYTIRFAGGPLDGRCQGAQGSRYSKFMGGGLIPGNPKNMAIYEYERSSESDGTTTRIYKFAKTISQQDAIELLRSRIDNTAF
jgi:hypothetical protein